MGRFHSGDLQKDLVQYISLPALAVIFLCGLAGCGGHRPAGASQLPAKITLSPGSSTSVQLGSTLIFTASAQNASNSNISLTFSFQSSDTSILNIAPTVAHYSGRWDAPFTCCTPRCTRVHPVTASSAAPTPSPT